MHAIILSFNIAFLLQSIEENTKEIARKRQNRLYQLEKGKLRT